MNLYEVENKRADHPGRGYVVAPSEERAAEFVFDHQATIGLTEMPFTLVRVDDELPEDRKVGLEDMLTSAPVCFASYCEPLGWVVHAAAVHTLRFFRIETVEGENTFVIAPDADVAAMVFMTKTPLAEGQQRLFRIFDDQNSLPPERIANLPELLELGPVGIVSFEDRHGWSVR